jgi:hypothetical protein
VSLTGLGTPTFEVAMWGVLDVYALFSSYAPRDIMKNCENIDSYGEYMALELSNCYFSSIKRAAGQKYVPFNKEVDPYGILTCFENGNHVHCEGNVVEYYERILGPSGMTR